MATTIQPAFIAGEAASDPGAGAAIKTILLHVQNDANLEARLRVALVLARATGAHLRCLHVTPIEAYVATGGFGGLFVMDRIIEQIDEEEEKLRSNLETRLSDEDVPWDYQQVTANTVTELVRCAALSDIVVTGRQADLGRQQDLEIGIIGDVLMAVEASAPYPRGRTECLTRLARLSSHGMAATKQRTRFAMLSGY